MSFTLIYLDPNSGGYHTGHCLILLHRAVADPRIRSIHFVLGNRFSSYAGGDPEELSGQSPKVTSEYLSDGMVDSLTNASLSPYRRGVTLWKEARRLVEARPGSVCFISLFDHSLLASILDRKPLPGMITGILQYPPFHLPMRKAPLKNAARWMVKRLSHYLVSYQRMPVLFTFDEYYLQTLPRFVARYWQFVPDPVPNLSELLQPVPPVEAPGERQARTRFLLFGSLGHRKGLGRLLDALDHLQPQERARMNIILAGEIREATTEQRGQYLQRIEAAKQLPGLILEHVDGYLSEQALVQQIQACDVVLAPYAEHAGVSAVVLSSMAAGKPIVSQNSGWVGYVVRKANLGLTCETRSPRALAETILLACRPEVRARYEASVLREFALGHSPDDYYEAIVSRLANLSAAGNGSQAD